eukprot:6513586-Pyramimonas_sp.AAC.1
MHGMLTPGILMCLNCLANAGSGQQGTDVRIAQSIEEAVAKRGDEEVVYGRRASAAPLGMQTWEDEEGAEEE